MKYATPEMVKQALNTAYPSYVCDTPYCSLVHAGGDFVQKASINLTGNGASTENLFTITGQCRILAIYFEVTAVGDATTFSNVKFETDDGAVQDDITAVVDGSGCAVGSLFQRNNTSGTALAFHNASTAGIIDGALGDVLAPFSVVQKNGATSYIRLSYTGDANTDITITASCRYAPLSDSDTYKIVAA